MHKMSVTFRMFKTAQLLILTYFARLYPPAAVNKNGAPAAVDAPRPA